MSVADVGDWALSDLQGNAAAETAEVKQSGGVKSGEGKGDGGK